eukprot:g14038.t1
MDGARRPPPSYEETTRRGEEALMDSPYNSHAGAGRPNGGAGAAYNLNSNRSGGSPVVDGGRRSSGGSQAAATSDMRQSLHGPGLKVVYYPPQRGKPEERMAWMNKQETEFALLKNAKSSVKHFMSSKKIIHQLADLKTVTRGVPPSEIYAARNFQTSPAIGQAGRTWRLNDHVPDARLTIRLRFAKGTVDIEGCTPNESMALYAILSQYAAAGQDPFASTRRPSPRPTARQPDLSSVGGAHPETIGAHVAFEEENDLDPSYKPTPGPSVQMPGRGLQNGGPTRQRSNLRAMIQQPAEFEASRELFLADEDQDNEVDAAAAALKPYTLAEVSGAVPQTPTCYVHREKETTRLAEALLPGNDDGAIGGATTVIFDAAANGKSVLAAAAMQDPRVQAAFPGGVIWLRAGHSAAGRLLRMMELAVCQVNEETERSSHGAVKRVPERFNDVGTASDYLSSLLVRTSTAGGLRGTLLVLDDVWEASVVEAFETVGLSLLVTTREPLIARLASPSTAGLSRLIGPLGPLSDTEALAAAAKAAATRRAPPKEAKQLLDRTGRCPLSVGVVASTLKQAQGPLDWSATSSKVKKTLSGLSRQRGGKSKKHPSAEDDAEDRVTASIAAGLSNMPEENQMLYSALCILPPGLPVSCRLLEQVWETGKRTTILAAEAFEHRRLLDRLGPGNFVLHYEAARFLQKPPGFAGDGAWVGCKLRGQGRELAFNRLCKHLDSFDTLRDHLAKRDLWGLTELWQTCEIEAKEKSGHSHVSCMIYESRLDLLRQEADIVAGPASRNRQSTAKVACEATLDLAQALDMVADYQAYRGCCDATPHYRESIDSLRQSLELVEFQGPGAGSLESRIKRALERITGKLGALLLKQGKDRDALHPCAESLTLIRARQGTDLGSDRASQLGKSHLPHQDVVDSLCSMAEALMKGNSTKEAEGMYEEAAIILRRLYGEEASLCLEVRGTERLASMMFDAGRMEQAEVLNDRALSDAAKAFSNVHPVVARIIDQRGRMLLAEKDLEGASSWFAEARQIREAFYGKGHALVAPSLQMQAHLMFTAGKVEDASALLKECLGIQEERYGPNDERLEETIAMFERMKKNVPPPVPEPEELKLRRAIEDATGAREALHLQGRLARFLRDRGPARYPEAEVEYERWMKGLQKAAKSAEEMGRPLSAADKKEADRELAGCVSEYMDVLEEQGKDLEELMWELLRVDKRVYGTGSAEVANDSDRFGRYLASKQSYGQAEQLLRKALTMKERSRGREHPEIAGILRAIGRVLFEVNGLNDAGDAFDRALAIDSKHGQSHADIIEDMRSLGMVNCRQGNYDKAESLYKKVVDMDKRLRGGEEDPSVITEMNVLAVLLYAQGKMDQAEPLLRRVLSLREKVLGEDHVDAAESLVNLAVLNNKKGKYKDALPMLERALIILENAHGRVHPETVACLSWIAETHQKQGQYREAEEILIEVVYLNRQILGDDNPGVADSLSDLAELRRAQGNLESAEENHLEALRIRVAKYGEIHETVAQSAQLLSLLLQSEGREEEAQDYGKRVVNIREGLHAAGGRSGGARNSPPAGSQEEHPFGC